MSLEKRKGTHENFDSGRGTTATVKVNTNPGKNPERETKGGPGKPIKGKILALKLLFKGCFE